MDYHLKFVNGLICIALLGAILAHTSALAKSTSAAADKGRMQRYIVVLDDPPLATYDGGIMSTPEKDNGSGRLPATANRDTRAQKLDVNSPRSKQYLQYLDQRFNHFRGEALLRLGRELQPSHRYRNALNGFATDLSANEVQAMRDVPGVKAVLRDGIQHLETDSGPNWLGADKIHDGSAGPFPAAGGEGVVVGIIDTGVNWDHPSFADPGEGSSPGWDHVNPNGTELGLCSDAAVLCNDKLVGVYDFVEDNPDTEVIEENNNGKDNDGHGSHVASTAAGNPRITSLSGFPVQIGGVAPNANIISYRVCFIADPADPDDDGCSDIAILSAIDQAIADGVDVINYSIGGDAFSPWTEGAASWAFLNARAAGILVATSAGNAGPNASSIGSPANAPWIMAVGNASHDRVFGSSIVENLSGGDTTPPGDLVGASLTTGLDIRNIVHAIDFGNALCGTGIPESGRECADNTGASSPFGPNTFNGEIVVCDRGEYGRVEKGKNVMLAGAGGYILVNTEGSFQDVVADDHCLPATHLNKKDGDELRTWLDSGEGHQGSLSGVSLFHIDEAGDQISSSSSRGPNLPPVENVMKPDVIAPGTAIFAAAGVGNNFALLSGTSMASAHVTGGAALLKSVHADWTPSMIASALTLTATSELALDHDDSVATLHKRGVGRPRLDEAVNAGIYLDETRNGFLVANPALGGKPKDLNLPGLVDTACFESCNFRRTVTDLAGGASWSASAEGFGDGVSVSITPDNFTLGNGASRLMTITVDLPQPDVPATGAVVKDVVGTWVYGDVRLASVGSPDAVFPLAVFANGGELPTEWQISSDRVSGWQEFALDGLVAMPDATFTSGGLVLPTEMVGNLPQDPTEDSPYDGGEGVMTVWHSVPAETLWLHAETLESSAEDIDLYVGLDSNGDGIAQESEELCASTSTIELELCDLFTPVAGEYWIIVQNWVATNDLDTVTLESAVVGKNSSSRLAASGSGMVAAGAAQNVRLSWDNVNAVPGTKLFGAVGVGTRRDKPNNIGIIPVRFTKTGVGNPETLVLMNGVRRGLTLAGGGMHDHVFIDVPPGTSSLTITASGADSVQSENLAIELYRVDFDDAFVAAPFVPAADTSGNPLASAAGTNGNGPVVTVTGGALVAGRWFVVLKNARVEPAAVDIQADLTFTGNPIPLRVGLWQASSRDNLRQGFDYTTAVGWRAFLWYTYDEDGAPAWYQAAAPEQDGNVWVAELLRYTNDGSLQQAAPVGYVSVTLLAEEDSIFSFVLFGENGSDREFPSLPPGCPTVDGSEQSYNGVWSRTAIGVGGATVVVNAAGQAFLHYIYDDRGQPVWLLASPDLQDPASQEMPLLQWRGFCAACTGAEPSAEPVGVFTRDFASEDNMSWNLNYILNTPLSSSIDRTDDAGKLTLPVACQ